jgi:alpha-beta hydrolase superfamily lysophospholipase
MDRTTYPEKFTSSDGLELYANWYLPEQQPRAGLLIVHGFADHGARYEHVAARFTKLGYVVLAADYRGNGRAAGLRGHCDRFEEFVWDLEAAANLLRRAIGDLPLGVYAHSHGGLVTLVALTQRRALAGARVVAFTSPFLAMGDMKVPRLLLKLVPLMSRLFPRFTQPHRIPPEGLTHDRAQVEAAGTDPLRHKVASVRWVAENAEARAQVRRDIAQIQVPTLWMIGASDPIANPEVTRATYQEAPEPKELVVYEGFLHELVNEIERQRVLDDLVGWFQRKIPLEPARVAESPAGA